MKTATVEIPLDVTARTGDYIPVTRRSVYDANRTEHRYEYDASGDRRYMAAEALTDCLYLGMKRVRRVKESATINDQLERVVTRRTVQVKLEICE